VRPASVPIVSVTVYVVPDCPAASHNTADVPSALTLASVRSPGFAGLMVTMTEAMPSPGLPLSAVAISN
jgi:hypothetical protein